MSRGSRTLAVVSVLGVMLGATSATARAPETPVQHGQYLVTIMSCNDCHTPGTLLGKPDIAHALSGSDVGFEVPGLGIFYGPNLTPDKETGIGNWSKEQIATTITTGHRPDGRILAPPMPVQYFKHLKPSDAVAIAEYLKTLPPVKHQVPGPFGTSEKPTSFVYQLRTPANFVPTPPPAPGK